MADFSNVLICAALALFIFTCIGLPLALKAAPAASAMLLAPGLGWAAHSALALPVFYVADMSRLTVIAAYGAPFGLAIVALLVMRPGVDRLKLGPLTLVALIGAAALALGVAAAVLPKVSAEGVSLAAPIFDHSKVAMINEMSRLGVPPGNPFFGGAGTPSRLAYYYLWHFSAAELSVLTGASGWEADAGLTWFTAFASLSLMIGLATWLSGRAAAGLWVVALAATASLRPLLNAAAGIDNVEAVAGYQSGFGGWLFQTSWAPQHTASAMAGVLAVVALNELARRPSVPVMAILGIAMAACFESSTWIGGIVVPLAALMIALLAMLRAERPFRLFLYLAGAALIAALLIAPMLYDQMQTAIWRGGGAPIAVVPYDVLTDRPDGTLGFVANLLAYWAIFLLVEFPAFYLAGLVAVFVLLLARGEAAERTSVVRTFALLLAVSLGAAWLLISTLGDNNDLGWRAVLPAVLLLIVFSAIALALWLERPISFAAVPALALVLLGLPDGLTLIYGNAVVTPNASSRVFAAAPNLWQAVRRHTSSTERIANNPYYLEHMTPWSANISWALLANRRSCYANAALVDPFSALSHARSERINAQFVRVFSGTGDADDVAQLAILYHCSVAVVTPQDGAWSRDPFAASPYYRLVEDSPSWRIYKMTTVAEAGTPQIRFPRTN
jgi:hypothetical protein